MCNDRGLFIRKEPVDVTLGDGHCLVAEGRGDVKLKMNLSNGNILNCKLHDVLYVPGLAYNLSSVYKAAVGGKSTVFSDADCEIRCIDGTVVAAANRPSLLPDLSVIATASLCDKIL